MVKICRFMARMLRRGLPVLVADDMTMRSMLYFFNIMRLHWRRAKHARRGCDALNGYRRD